MRSLLLAVILFAQTSRPVPVPAGQTVQTGTISGRLLALDGKPAAGVRVSGMPVPETAKVSGTAVSDVPVLTSLAQTDATGRFRLENLPPGRYYVLAGFVDFPTYYPGVTTTTAATVVSVTARATVGAIDFQAARTSTGLTLKGRLKRDSNEGVGGVNIALYGNDQYPSTQSLPDGSFEFSKLRPGTYSLSMSIPGFQSRQPQQVVLADKDIVGMEIIVPWTVEVKGSMSVEGGGPRPNFNLTFAGGTRGVSSTGARETFQTTLQEGAYAVAANGLPSGFFIKSIMSGSLDLQKEPLILSRSATPPPVIVMLGVSSPSPWVKLSGRVSGLPSPRSQVQRISLYGSIADRLDTEIAADGSFEFPKLLPGQYTANINPSPVSIPPTTIVVPNSDLVGVVLSIPAAMEVSGRITVEDGGPLPMTSMNLTGSFGVTVVTASTALAPLLVSSIQQGNTTSMSLTIQKDGTFKASLPEGKYQITAVPQFQNAGSSVYVVKAFNYGATDLIKDSITASVSDSASLNLTLGPRSPIQWSKVTGRVVGVDASILESNPLTVTLNSPGLLTAWTSPVKSDGTFEFPKIYPAAYTARIAPAGRAGLIAVVGNLNLNAATAALNVGGADITGFEIAVPHQKEIAGKVVLEGRGFMPRFSIPLSTPLSPANILIINPQADGSFKVTVPEGERQVGAAANLPPGYSVKSVMYGATDLLKNPLKIVASDNAELRVTLATPDIAPVRVSGKLTGVDDAAFARGRITVTLSGSGNRAPISVPVDATLNADRSFQFPAVFPGDYNVRASGAGIVSSPSVSVAVVNADVANIEIAIPRQKEISGRVSLEGRGTMPRFAIPLTSSAAASGSGAPLFSGTQFLNINPQADGSFKVTVQEGERGVGILSLPAGYAVKSLMYGTTDLLKSPLKVATSDAAEFRLTLTTADLAPVRVSGRVTGVEDSVFARGPVIATLNGTGVIATLTAPVSADRSFQFPEVFSGNYTVRAIGAGLINSPNVPVSVANADVANIEIAIPRQKEISGRVILEGRGTMPRFAIPLPSSDLISGSGTVILNINPQADGSFKVTALEGERVVGAASNLPAGYAVKSLMYGTTDLLKNPLKVSASDSAELRVTLTTPDVAPVRVSGKLTGVDDTAFARGPIRALLSGSGTPLNVPVDADRSFQFPEVFPGNYTVRATGPGVLVSSAVSVTVATADVTNIEIAVGRQKEISGRVILEGRGAIPRFQIQMPLPATPGVVGSSSMSLGVSPAADGSFKVTLPAGDQRLGAIAGIPSGYTVKAVTYGGIDVLKNPLKISEADNVELFVTLAAPDLAPVRVSGKLTGVDDAAFARGTVTATLTGPGTATPRSATVKADRTFEFPDVFPGNYIVVAAVPGALGPATINVTVARTDISNLEIVVPRQREVIGKMILEGTGIMPRIILPLTPVGGSLATSTVLTSFVVSLPPGLLLSTAANAGNPLAISPQPDGTFRVVLPEGERRLGTITGLPPGYTLKSLTYGSTDILKNPLKVAASDTDELRVIVTTSNSAPVRVSGRIAGLDENSFAKGPVNASMSSAAYATVLNVTVSPDGSFEFPTVYPGSFTVRAQGPGIVSSPVLTVTVTDSDIRNIEIRIPSFRDVTGHVVVEGGGPYPILAIPPVAVVQAVGAIGPASGSLPTIRPGTDGTFRLALPLGEMRANSLVGLPPGYTAKSFTYGSTDLLRNPLRIAAGDSAELQLTLVNTSTPVKVSGRVDGVDLTALAGSPVQVVMSDGSFAAPLTTVVRADGTFEFSRVYPGIYRLTAAKGSSQNQNPNNLITIGPEDRSGLVVKISQ